MIQKLLELMVAHPFRFFSVVLSDGRRFDVSSPDMVWLPAQGRGGLHFFDPDHDRIVSVNPQLISSVEWISAGMAADETGGN